MSQDSLILPTTGTLSGLALVMALNDALANLDSLTSGATDPSSLPGGVRPFSLWMDTSVTPAVVRQRNATNDGWGAPSVAPATQPQHAVQFGQMQASMLGASAVTLVPTATTLTSANAGQLLVFSSGVVGTLPAASSIKSGQGLQFFSIVAGASVARAGTTNTITVGSANVTSIALNAGDTLTLISNGSNGWYAIDGSAQLQYAASMQSAQSLGQNGYRKLPAYPGDPVPLVVQWGIANTGASPAAVTFPIAFPNACRSVTLGANYSTSPAGAQITSGPSTTGFSLQMTTFTGTNLTGQSVAWMAIGN
ncbi:gp53-like domain-containing protein [Pandoraea bronchicola]|uniref:Putative tail fiber protein gp53-like C-terminal domain-containing protein n=1 Tax=Pandoraea bronchicola TaxID=2508287 RepID=A0A5E5C1F5_9BURK|nr:hypothetical protein PBR20603_04377 [Pandoraea bronchicola]